MSSQADHNDGTHSQDSGRRSRQRDASDQQRHRELSHDSGQDDNNEPIKPSISEPYVPITPDSHVDSDPQPSDDAAPDDRRDAEQDEPIVSPRNGDLADDVIDDASPTKPDAEQPDVEQPDEPKPDKPGRAKPKPPAERKAAKSKKSDKARRAADSKKSGKLDTKRASNRHDAQVRRG